MVDLVMVPGLVCDATAWSSVIELLGPRARCAVFDPGRADSLGAMANALLAQAPARFSIAGHSMGARVALEAIRRAPERIERLALLDTSYLPRPAGQAGEDERRDRLALVELAKTHGMRAMAERWLPPLVHPDRLRDAPLMRSLADMACRRDVRVLGAQVKALLDRPDATPVLRTVRCPTLVLCGRDDGWSGLARHQEMAAIVRRAQLVVLERCGHMSTVERPAEVSASLARWLHEPAAA